MTIKITNLEQIENLTEEDILKISEQSDEETFDLQNLKNLKSQIQKEKIKLIRLGEAFSEKCAKLEHAPSYDEEEVNGNLFEILSNLAWEMDMRYGEDWEYGGEAHTFWEPSTC